AAASLAPDGATGGTTGFAGTGDEKEAEAGWIRRANRRETIEERGEMHSVPLQRLRCKGNATVRLARAPCPRGSRPATSEPLCFCSTAVLRTGWCRQGGVIPSAHASEDDAGVVL